MSVEAEAWAARPPVVGSGMRGRVADPVIKRDETHE